MIRLLIMFGLGTIFVLGYTAGEHSTLYDDRAEVIEEQEVVEVITKWRFPNICQDTIVHGLQNTWADKGRIKDYHELAGECFRTVEKEVPNVTYDLPAPAMYIIPNEEEDEDLTDRDYLLIENAYADCIDDNFDIMNDEVENYCDENYEDYLD